MPYEDQFITRGAEIQKLDLGKFKPGLYILEIKTSLFIDRIKLLKL
jgi:hypothetical protein